MTYLLDAQKHERECIYLSSAWVFKQLESRIILQQCVLKRKNTFALMLEVFPGRGKIYSPPTLIEKMLW
jgi:hypothetical protein